MTLDALTQTPDQLRALAAERRATRRTGGTVTTITRSTPGTWDDTATPSGPDTAAIAREVDLFAGMNKTERAWAIVLEAQRRDGLIREWRYEEVTFRLAADTRYTPDFFVVEPLGAIRFDEVKGRKGAGFFARDDAKVKIKVAARLFPHFRFRYVWYDGASWQAKDVEP